VCSVLIVQEDPKLLPVQCGKEAAAKMDIEGIANENVDWMPLALDGPVPVLLHTVTNHQCTHKFDDFSTS
jgi:hypothetical protein